MIKFSVLTSAPSMLIFSALSGKQKKIHKTFCICCSSLLSGWFKFYFPCFEVWQCMIMSLKERKIKSKPQIKLNHNKHNYGCLFQL